MPCLLVAILIEIFRSVQSLITSPDEEDLIKGPITIAAQVPLTPYDSPFYLRKNRENIVKTETKRQIYQSFGKRKAGNFKSDLLAQRRDR